MRYLLLALAVLLSPRAALATGWNDFVQPIGDGYSIARSTTVVLTNNGLVDVGDDEHPVAAFAVTPTLVFAKTEPSGGGTPNFYVVQKQAGTVVGPLTAEAFAADPDVAKAGTLAWQVPTNPHPEVARDGQLMFLAFMAVIFGVPIILLVAVLALIVLKVRRRTGRRRPPGAVQRAV